MPSAYAECQHCAARGSYFVEETRDEAIKSAKQAWAEALRPGRLSLFWRAVLSEIRGFIHVWRTKE